MNLIEHSTEHVPYPPELQLAVQRAAMSWRNFLSLPSGMKASVLSSDSQSGVGYERKLSGERESHDHKENFDITQPGIDQLRTRTTEPTILQLLEDSEQLLWRLNPVAQKFCDHVEAAYNVPGFGEKAAHSASNRFIRYLWYPPVDEGTIVGEAHTDHSGYTFHLYESTGGCYGLSPASRNWFAMEVDDDEMLAFAGMQLQLMTSSYVKALCHEIRASSIAAVSGRLAIVCFNRIESLPAYNRSQHGRLQDKVPGFNYSMPAEAFTDLFSE